MDDFDLLWQTTQAAAPDFVGLSRSDAGRRAEEFGLRLRVVDWDVIGNDGRFALTADLRADRLTLHIRDGVVTQSTPG